MAEKMTRRSFIKRSAAMGATTVIGGTMITSCGKGRGRGKRTDIDIAVAHGTDYFADTMKAVEELGGMECFVPEGSSVAILANPQRNNPGAFTKPQILKAAVQMCKKAGAGEICCISQLPDANWEGTGLKKVVTDEGIKLVIVDRQDDTQFKPVPIPNGTALKEAMIMNVLYDYDVFIDMPITKDHAGNKFTGTMKNLMGLNGGTCNRSFHKENWTTDMDAIAHLEQCIADLNTVVTPDLCIVDATEFITTKGPFGPGDIVKPQKVVAGTDRVAVDAYCCTLWGLQAKDIMQITKAYDLGVGEIDLNKKKLKEIEA
jgi:uncharacterized protein (DUF362 family)